ncbi:site-specific integrase [Paenibacillus sp. XY044]|uniref:tyrosine-type recombinase/integrase n=1 Tax=Paenibacillus sp. XY044 TaxID=2026089 RepID=UPI000B98E32B|nr:site-specific integrase [Paenibacillus sp. XY044]OZB96553.1 hypothetical protein CJP46_11795 [Paenibacillus sp. XY044]
MDDFKSIDPTQQNPRQINDLESSPTQESFRQNLYFAEKILDLKGIFPPLSDDHDIRKVTREKVENMLYAQHVLTDNPTPNIESIQHYGRSGINLWIWNNKVQKLISQPLLLNYMKQIIPNDPPYYLQKLTVVLEIQQLAADFLQMEPAQIMDDQLVEHTVLQHIIENVEMTVVKANVLNYFISRSTQTTGIERTYLLEVTARVKKDLHPKITEFKMNMQNKGLSKEHIRKQVAAVDQLFSWLCKNIHVFSEENHTSIQMLKIQSEHLLSYRTYLLKKVNIGAASPISFCHKISAIKSYFYFLRERYGIEPPLQRFRAIKAPRYNPRDLPNEEQIATFFQTVQMYSDNPIQETVGFRLLLELGLRLSEAAQVAWDDINLGRRTIVIHSKGGKSHMLPLVGKLYDGFTQLKKVYDKHPLVLGEKSSSIADRLYRNFKLYALIAGWQYPGGVHLFRHMFITRLAYKGVLPQAVKELTRVKRLNTVSLYIHLGRQNQYLTNQIDKLSYD